MGAYLSKPEKEKMFEAGENEWMRFASCTMQGWRVHQEDAHNCIVDFGPALSYFAVYDGHGGREVAQYLAQHFPDFLKQQNVLDKLGDDQQNVQSALQQLFIDFDSTLREETTVKIMGALKEADLPKKPEDVDDPEEAERNEREALYEEAIALSKEAKVSLETIIMKYAKCRNILIESAEAAEESRGSKRGVSSTSPQVPKRRKINKSEAIDEGGGEEDNDDLPQPATNETNGAKQDDKLGENAKAQPTDAEMKEFSPKKGAKEESGLNGDFKLDQKNNDNHGKRIEPPTDEPDIGDHAEKSDSGIGKSRKQPSRESTASEKQDQPEPSSSSSSHSAQQKDNEPDEEEEDDPDFQVEDEPELNDSESEEEEAATDADDTEHGDEEEEDEEEEEFDEEDLGSLLSAAETGTKAGFDSGSTACVAFIFKERVIIANIGDSRAVLFRDGKAVELSVDHKPEDDTEKKRILAAGGKVGEDGRVNGGLNLSRAFGDHYYKQKQELPLQEQMITALPDVTIFPLNTETDEFLVIACDGIWNSMSSQQVCDFVAERIDGKPLKEIVAELCEACCAKDTTGDGSGCDNETVILIDLNKGKRPPISPTSTSSPILAEPAEDAEFVEAEADSTTNPGGSGNKKEEAG